MILNGNNLGERHRDLNSKVAEAVSKETNFEELKSQPELCDVDKLFKIDLASKYKDVIYILDVLKCGDKFYVSRALKCLWLYSDEYTQFINTHYLETNVFPYMSEKIKRKMLTCISTHMRNPNRAIEFYKYCVEEKLNDYAVKFLVNTPDDYKLELLKDAGRFKYFADSKFLKQFIGSSFVVAMAYLRLRCYSTAVVFKLRFLYSVSDESYLKILEDHTDIDAGHPYCSERLGIRISKDILMRHKHRIIDKPVLYVNILNRAMLVKHLSVEDVKSFTLALLPNSSNYFWSMDFYKTYKFFLEKFPPRELYIHLRQIYISKYEEDEFEMRIEFYRLGYYNMLNIDEREKWALRHIERDKEHPGIDNYIWYKFVSFPKASSGIKRYIFLTPDKNERSRIINIFPETARNMEDIYKILCYYYERHVNESEEHKESFINKFIEHQDIYSFNSECWTSLDKLFYSLDVYTTGAYTREEYKLRSTIYHILHEMELPEALTEYIGYVGHFYNVSSIIDELSEERKAVVAKYLLNYYVEKIGILMEHPDYLKEKDSDEYWESGSIKDQIHCLVHKAWNVIDAFKRNKEECPEIVRNYMEANKSFYSYHELYKVNFEKKSEEDFVRWLKHDTEMAIDGIYEIRCNTYRWNFRLSRLFRKLKVYFSNDVGKEYLEYFTDYLADVPKGFREYRNIKMAVVGVFYLAEPDYIINFLEKNLPAAPKIDHKNIDKQLLQVQKAICRLAYHARPPLPLNIFQKYIVGDYVHYCLPVFYNYFANLPSNSTFIDILLDAPLSIQKHGLRLAFRSYNTDKLIPIIKSAWKKTKNVSLRMILYETLFYRILNDKEDIQRELYEILKYYTSELNHDDHETVYSLLVSDDLPNIFKGDFIETAWLTVDALPTKIVDVKRRISVICYMEKYMHFVNRDFIRLRIINNHVNNMLHVKKNDKEYHFKELYISKWNLTAKYIMNFNTEVEKQKSLELMQVIMSKSIKYWDSVAESTDTYVVRKFIQKFITTIMHKDPKTVDSCAYTVFVYQCILDNLQRSRKKEEIYLKNWELQLSITCRNMIYNGRNKDSNRNMSSREAADAYGKEVANTIINLNSTKEFYSCFYQSIADIVNNVGSTICNILGTGSTGFVYYVCDSLTDFKMTETHVLALFMLPRDPPYNWESEHAQSIQKLKQFESQEIRSFLYEKYVMSDCKVRSYV